MENISDLIKNLDCDKNDSLESFRKIMKEKNRRIQQAHLKEIAQKFGFTSAWVSLMFGLLPTEEKLIIGGEKIVHQSKPRTFKYLCNLDLF